MKDKRFNIKLIPNVPNNIIQTIEQAVTDIRCNYEVLTRDSIKLLELSVENNIVKPLTIYNLFFLVEIYLKFYLVENSKLSILEIENQGHNIVGLIETANQVNEKIKFDKIKFLLQKFRNKDNQRLELHRYYDFKYNRKIGDESLIFDFQNNEIEIRNIKEVIEWIKCHIQIL